MTLLLLSRKRFQPRSIPNLQLWLDATQINQADNTSVASWADQSGNAYNAEQSTTAARPTYRTNQLNGLPAVVFDGTDDRLTIPSSTATFKFLHSDVSTVFIVARAGSVADPNNRYGIIGTNANSTLAHGYMINYDDRASQSYNNVIFGGITNGSGWRSLNIENNYFTPNIFNILTIRSDPANSTPLERSIYNLNGGTDRKNNTQNGSLSTSNATHNFEIGSTGNFILPFLGAISEIIVYNRALNTSELAQVHRYLARKWGIQLA